MIESVVQHLISKNVTITEVTHNFKLRQKRKTICEIDGLITTPEYTVVEAKSRVTPAAISQLLKSCALVQNIENTASWVVRYLIKISKTLHIKMESVLWRFLVGGIGLLLIVS